MTPRVLPEFPFFDECLVAFVRGSYIFIKIVEYFFQGAILECLCCAKSTRIRERSETRVSEYIIEEDCVRVEFYHVTMGCPIRILMYDAYPLLIKQIVYPSITI